MSKIKIENMEEILKQAFDKANDIVTRYERNDLTLREKVNLMNALCEETETKVKNVSANSCVSDSLPAGIDWKKLRVEFFYDLTRSVEKGIYPKYTEIEFKCMPHNVFEWFKGKLAVMAR